MARQSWIRSLIRAAEAHASLPVTRAKPLRAGEIRVVDRNAPIDFLEDRTRYEVEILNADARPGDDVED
jgi:hypothetical protein